jgi:hypothetical protein
MISGASISNIFYQGKLIVTTVFGVIVFAIWGAIGGSLFPYVDKITGQNKSFSGLIHQFHLDNWFYWVLIFLLFFSIVYTVISGQKNFEKHTHEYRKKRNVKHKKEFKNDKYEYNIYENKSLDDYQKESNKKFSTKKRINKLYKK